MPLSIDEILSNSQKKNLCTEAEKSKNRIARYKSWKYHQSSLVPMIFPFEFERETIINNLDKYIKIERQVLDVLQKQKVYLHTVDPEIRYYLFRYCYYFASKKNLHGSNIRVYRHSCTVKGTRVATWFKILSQEFAKRFSEDCNREEMLYKDVQQNISDDFKRTALTGTKPSWSKYNKEDCWSKKTNGIVVCKSDLEKPE